MDWDSLSAGIITALSNRIGDGFFILSLRGMRMCLCYRGADAWFCKSEVYIKSSMECLGLLIVLSRITKRAVIPFSAWLPEAIAAPTPVSRLVHSSTLVTAGVYMLIRFGEFVSPLSIRCLYFFSLLTVIMAGVRAISLMDIKKVVALSTLRQVRLMIMCIRCGAIRVGFFHLLVHAFFKALIFMCIGSVIFYSGGVQDARSLGSLWWNMPMVSMLILISNFSLIGFPFFSGYYRKELIVGACLRGSLSFLRVFLVYLSLALTLLYSCRMVWLICCFKERVPISSFYRGNFFLESSLWLMSWGAVFGRVLMQCFVKKFNFYSLVSGVYFYRGLTLASLWVVNFLVFFWGSVSERYKRKFKYFVSRL